jgi:hypothetical protein
MKKHLLKLSLILLLLTLLYSCTDTNVTPNTANYFKVTDAVSTGGSFNVTMYANDTLFVGYDKVYFNVTDMSTGKIFSQAKLVLNPEMDLGTTKLTCPFENPLYIKNIDGLYEGSISFSMIGANSWSVSVEVTANGITETVKLDIPVVIAAKKI